MQQNYSPKVLDHYRNPRGSGKLEGATHTASELNPLCGDEITVYLNVRDGKIEKMMYEARGCALSIASASALAESIKYKVLSIKEIKKFQKEDIEKILEIKVSPARESCVMLVLNTIKKSLSFP